MASKKEYAGRFKGIITPMVTPLLNDTKLDRKGLERLTGHLVEGGVSGLFALGTTGEGTSLAYELRREMISATCALAKDRVPVLFGITDSSLVESIALAEAGKKMGATAVVAAPPYYFSLNQRELIAYYRRLADESKLPVFIYNMPAHTKTMIEVDTVRTLSDHPNIIGIKDSSGTAPYFNNLLYYLKEDTEFSVFVGPDEMLSACVMSGADGGVNSGSNMFPRLFTNLYEAASSRDLEKVAFCQREVIRISAEIYSIGNSSFRFLKGIKAALSVLGICKNILAFPLDNFSGDELKMIEKTVAEITHSELSAL